MESLLSACRENFGPPPRRIPWLERPYLHARAPQWAAHDDLRRVIRDRNRLLTQGRIVLGAVVEANTALYRPGKQNLPALAIWSDDPFYEAKPCRLRELGRELFAMKGQHTRGDLAETARLLTSARLRPLGYKLPDSFGDGKALWLTTLLVFREHLPCGFLNSKLLPLLVCPEETPAALILPGKYWPDAWKDR